MWYSCRWQPFAAFSQPGGPTGALVSAYTVHKFSTMMKLLPLFACLFASASAQICPDLDGSGAVDVEDILGVLAMFGNSCDNGNGMSCEEEHDVAVALEYCNNSPTQGGADAGTPESAVVGLCYAQVSDINAVYELCLVEGIAGTAGVICSGLGYSATTCADAAAIAEDALGSGNDESTCSVAANAAASICGLFTPLVQEDTCEQWATVDGPGIAMASEHIMNLAPADAMTTVSYCEGFPNAPAATEAVCNSISAEDLIGSCEAVGASSTINTLCLELGFDVGPCTDAVAMFESDPAAAGALELYGCAALPGIQPGFCAMAATLTDADEACIDWAGPGFMNVDMDAFNLAVGTMEMSQLSILSSVCSSTTPSEACTGHPIGHICATVDNAAACGIASDVAVALAYCESTPAQGGAEAGTPQSSVFGICQVATSDADALSTICAAEGVSVTAHIICSGLGYSSGTCDDVAAIAVGAFGEGNDAATCAALAAGASALCPQVLPLVDEDTCQQWAEIDGPNLALGTSAILDLQQHIPAGITSIDYCESVQSSDGIHPVLGEAGNGQVATYEACNGIPAESFVAACEAIGASQTIYTLCIDLGFSSTNCDAAVAMFENNDDMQAAIDAFGCAALNDLQSPFCAAAAQSLTAADENCVDWGGYGYLANTYDADGLNAAIETLEGLELSLLAGACEAVDELGAYQTDEICHNHPLGHICATIGELSAEPPPPVCEDNNALVSATAGSECPDLVPIVGCEYETGAGPLSLYCPLTCGNC